ncbi:MAG: hypothetical protein KDD40_07435, partial [Bdellovibrionales bacterium]|nr:hypothetical protein [Bdellovibrionales bacterium]
HEPQALLVSFAVKHLCIAGFWLALLFSLLSHHLALSMVLNLVQHYACLGQLQVNVTVGSQKSLYFFEL